MEKLHKYRYVGPVLEFNRIVHEKWQGATMASSASKARSNLEYQFKQKFGRAPRAKISLPGKIELLY